LRALSPITMDIFPTQYSTLSSVALKVFLEKQYGFKDMTCQLLIHNVSDTYVLDNGIEKYVFKIYRDQHRKLEEIKGEVELLNALIDKGAKVSYPIKDLTGNQIQTFNAAEGIRYGVLFSYAKGKVFNELSDEQLGIIGQEMAAIHNITANITLSHYRKEFNIDTTINLPLKVIKEAFNELETEYAYLTNTAEEVIAKLGQFDLSKFSYGYCHYDFLPKNFHFDEDNNITFFDFDFSGKGYLANDITSFYIHFFMDVSYNRLTKTEADRAFNIFIENYRKVKPLHDDELKAIPYLGFAFWVFYLGFQYENFDDWSSIFFGPKFLKDRVALIRKWMNSFEE